MSVGQRFRPPWPSGHVAIRRSEGKRLGHVGVEGGGDPDDGGAFGELAAAGVEEEPAVGGGGPFGGLFEDEQGGIPGERVGAIVYPNEEWFAQENGGKKPDWDEMEKVVSKRVQERSAELADYKRVRKVVVYREPLERTSVGKVRRVTYKGKLDE